MPASAVILSPERELRPTALGLVRCLGRAGVPVVVASSGSLRNPSRFSRYVSRHHIVPSAAADPDGWRSGLIALARSLDDKPVLYPSSDEHVWQVHRHRDELSRYFHYPFLDPDALRGSLDKWEMCRACQSRGIETGRIVRVPEGARAVDVAGDAIFPSVLKPVAWVDLSGAHGRPRRPFQQEFGAKALSIAGAGELDAALRRASNLGVPLLLQEEVPGPSSAILHVSLYADATSQVRGLFVARKRRQYPSKFGDACLLETEPCDEAARLAAAVVKAIGFHGLAGAIEFKRHPSTGRLHFLEINPRVAGSIALAVPAGANLPHLAYLDAIGAEIPPMTVGERKVRWVDGRRDFLYWMAYRNGDHAGERLRFRDYLDSLRGPRECAFWAADDPWPLLAPSTTFPGEFWQHVRRGR